MAVARYLLTCRSERPKAESGERMALEIKSVDSLVGTPISYAYAVKAGPWVFLTGHEAFDWRTGTIDASVSGPAGFPAYGTRHPSRREADLVLRRMTDVLRDTGLTCRIDPARPILPKSTRGGRLSPVATRQFRRLHPAEYFGGHGTPVWRQFCNFDLAGCGDAGARPGNS